MLALIIAVILSLGFAYLATQNSQGVSINLGNYIIPNIPLYFVALGSLLLGLLMAGILGVVNGMSSAMTIFGKNRQIQAASNTIDDLKAKIQELEVENAGLKEEKKGMIVHNVKDQIDHSQEKVRGFFDRIRHGLST